MQHESHLSHYITLLRCRNTAELSRSRIIVELEQPRSSTRLTNIYKVRYEGISDWVSCERLGQPSGVMEWLYIDSSGTPSIYWNSMSKSLILL